MNFPVFADKYKKEKMHKATIATFRNSAAGRPHQSVEFLLAHPHLGDDGGTGGFLLHLASEEAGDCART